MLGKILTVMLATMMEVILAQMMVGMLLTMIMHVDDDGHYGDAVETNRDGDGSEGYVDDCNDVEVVDHDDGYVRNDVDNDDVHNHDDNESDFDDGDDGDVCGKREKEAG